MMEEQDLHLNTLKAPFQPKIGLIVWRIRMEPLKTGPLFVAEPWVIKNMNNIRLFMEGVYDKNLRVDVLRSQWNCYPTEEDAWDANRVAINTVVINLSEKLAGVLDEAVARLSALSQKIKPHKA